MGDPPPFAPLIFGRVLDNLMRPMGRQHGLTRFNTVYTVYTV